MIRGIVEEDRVIIWERKKAKELFEKKYFGKLREDRLELSLIEAYYLVEKGIIEVHKDGKKMSKKEFYNYCCEKDNRFYFRYVVYKDLRDRELPTKTGFKFGCDFRVYQRGVHPLKRGKKTQREHTKWVVFSVPEGYTFSFPELARAVRLAHTIRANMLWAVVSKDGKVKYFQVKFFKP
jgi:tRNA-intron endonuclease